LSRETIWLSARQKRNGRASALRSCFRVREGAFRFRKKEEGADLRNEGRDKREKKGQESDVRIPLTYGGRKSDRVNRNAPHSALLEEKVESGNIRRGKREKGPLPSRGKRELLHHHFSSGKGRSTWRRPVRLQGKKHRLKGDETGTRFR